MKLSHAVSILTVTCLCGSAATAQSGWVRQSSGTTSSLYSVAFADVHHGIAVGYNTILRTTNGGETWESQNPEMGGLIGVSLSGTRIGLVVGFDGTILRTTNGGESWTSQTGATNRSLSGVCLADTNAGTAVGDSGTILRTTNGGVSWTNQPSGTLHNLRGVSFADANIGTAVGDSGTILRTTNAGTTWTVQTSGTTESLEGVSFTDALMGTVVGAAGTILRTSNGGALWAPQETSMKGFLCSVSFSNATNGTIVGFFDNSGCGRRGCWGGSSDDVILHTTDGGISWSAQSPDTAGGALWGVCFTDDNTGTAVGYGPDRGAIFRTTTGGLTWVRDDPNTSRRLPTHVGLDQNYPNPFNPQTTIRYSVPHRSHVTLTVYNMLGQKVTTLVNGDVDAGYHDVTFNAAGLASGVYFYRLQAGAFVQARKLLLVR